MSQPVQVGGEVSPWIHAGRALGPLALLGALVVLCFTPAPPVVGYLAAIAGAALIVGFESHVAWRRWSRRWVEDTGAGFVFTDFRGARAHADGDVAAMALFEIGKYSEGRLMSNRRCLHLWVRGEPRPLKMENVIPVGQPDPIEALKERVILAVCDRCESELARGQPVAGEGWTLGASSLTLQTSAGPQILRFDEIQSFQIVDNQVCFWRRGQDEAIAKLPLSSRNVHVLQLLLATRVSDQPDDDGAGLGRVLFERRGSRFLAAACFVLTAPSWLAAVGLAFFIEQGATAGISAVTCAAAGLLLPFVGAHLWASNFRCHERGVFQSGLLGQKQLFYWDVASFTYSATRHYHNGVYTGTILNLRFDPLPGKGKAIAYGANVQKADAGLDMLRDFVAESIGRRMAAELAANQRVEWTSNLALRTDGLEYRPANFLGVRSKESKLLPWGECRGFDVQQGTFMAWQEGLDKPVMQEPASQPNFFPGYFLLLTLTRPREAEEETGVEK